MAPRSEAQVFIVLEAQLRNIFELGHQGEKPQQCGLVAPTRAFARPRKNVRVGVVLGVG